MRRRRSKPGAKRGRAWRRGRGRRGQDARLSWQGTKKVATVAIYSPATSFNLPIPTLLRPEPRMRRRRSKPAWSKEGQGVAAGARAARAGCKAILARNKRGRNDCDLLPSHEFQPTQHSLGLPACPALPACLPCLPASLPACLPCLPACCCLLAYCLPSLK